MKSEIISHKNPLEYLAPAGRVGLILLATDFNTEKDLRRMLPEGVEVFTSRVLNVNPLTIDNLRTMQTKIGSVAATLLPGTDLDVVIYACTSGSIVIGSDKIQQIIQETNPRSAVVNPYRAACAAFNEFSAKKLSILTPYTESVNQHVASSFTNEGYEVLNIAGFDYIDDTAMTFIEPNDIQQAAMQIIDANSDLLFISCTSLRASLVIEEIERKINKPVISSNQALAWHTLRALNYQLPIKGFGSLLRRL